MKWVRSQTGKLEIKPKEFDLSVSVEEALALVSNAAFRKQITLSSKVLKDTMVYADHEMVNTCMINLLSNAVKFTPLNGSVLVMPETNGAMIKVHVKDTGVGISPENMQKLFRLDTKSGTPGTANEKGTGLGLLLVKEFAEKNNGSISVQSNTGEGSIFTLTIPKA
jgi:signal transduction histidine kinase